jgi:hypothetical protein
VVNGFYGKRKERTSLIVPFFTIIAVFTHEFSFVNQRLMRKYDATHL